MEKYYLEKKIFFRICKKSGEEYTDWFDGENGHLIKEATWLNKEEVNCFNQRMDQYRELWPELQPMVINSFLKYYIMDCVIQNQYSDFKQYMKQEAVKMQRKSLPEEILNLKLNKIFE